MSQGSGKSESKDVATENQWDLGMIMRELNNVEVQIPQGMEVPTITLTKLVEENILNVGKSVSVNVKGTIYRGTVRTLSDGEVVLFSQEKAIYSNTPHGFIERAR
jgi:molybdopterin-binding protein